jgi:hypothetical protein
LLQSFDKCTQQDSLKDKHLTVSIAGLPPWVIYTDDPLMKPVHGVTGVDVMITDSIAKQYGCTFEFKRERYIGTFVGNGSWEGTTGSVRYNLRNSRVCFADFRYLI